MRELHVVATSEDGRHVVLATRKGVASGDYRVALDERLAAAVRGDLPRPGESAPTVVTPKEIQARLRAGESPEQVASSAGVPVAKIDRYAGPVLAERERVIAQARAGFVTRSRLGASALPLGEAVDRHLNETTGVRLETVAWSARREDSGTWLVELCYVSQARRRSAVWRYDRARREVSAVDNASAQLAHVEPGRRSRSAEPAQAAPARPTSRSRRSEVRPAAPAVSRVAARPAPPVRAAAPVPRSVAPARAAQTAANRAAVAKAAREQTARAAAQEKAASAAAAKAAREAAAAEQAAAVQARAADARAATQAAARAAAKAEARAEAKAEAGRQAAAARAAAAQTAAAEKKQRAEAARLAKAEAARAAKADAARLAKAEAARLAKAEAARAAKAEAVRAAKAERGTKADAARAAKAEAARTAEAEAAQVATAEAAAEADAEAARAEAVRVADSAPSGPPTLRVVGSDAPAPARRPKEPPAAARTTPARAAGQRASVPGWADVLLSTAPVARPEPEPDEG